ncbi:MAG: hypothetical protein WC971_03095 [Coriobacteriia bacterium]
MRRMRCVRQCLPDGRRLGHDLRGTKMGEPIIKVDVFDMPSQAGCSQGG